MENIVFDTIEELEAYLRSIYNECEAAYQIESTKEGKISKKAYAKGIKDALDLINLHMDQQQLIEDFSEIEPEPDYTEAKKLYQMTSEEVISLGIDNIFQAAIENNTEEDLAEAAFKFENELIALLGDENTIPFDSYAVLSTDKLIGIIEKSISDISRLKNNP